MLVHWYLLTTNDFAVSQLDYRVSLLFGGYLNRVSVNTFNSNYGDTF